MIKRHKATHVAAALLIGLLGASGSQAEQWYVEPRADLYNFYDDNVGMDIADPVSSAGFLLTGHVKTGRRTENTDIGILSTATRRQYFSDANRNTTDFFFDATGVRRIERDRFALNARLDLDSSLTSELSGSGRIQDRKRRTSWLVAPSWQRQLSEITALRFDASYRDVAYDDGLSSGLFDYKYWTLGTQITQGLSETTQVIGRLSFDHFESDLSATESDTLGLLAGITHAFSEDWTATVLLGLRRAEQQTSGTDNASTGSLFDVSLNRKFEVGSLRFGLSRDLSPSGSGGVLETTRLSVVWKRPVTARLTGNLDILAYRNNEADGTGSPNDRKYYSVAPSLQYRLDRDWSLTGGYRYRYQKYDNNSDGADSNLVFLNIVYSPRRERADLDLTR